MSRHLNAAAKRLHEKVARYIEILDADLEITWKDCMAMCAVWPNLLRGPETCELELPRDES